MNLRNLLKSATRFLQEPRIIYDREGKDPYLSRYYLVREKPTDDAILKGQSAGTDKARSFDLFLHHFHRSDQDAALHNHPWEWGLSFILVGGYIEERRQGDRVFTRRVLPFTFNLVKKVDYHRVDLIEEDAWSLFLVGPRVDTWYFWDRVKKARMEWRAFIEAKRLGVEGKWIEDTEENMIFSHSRKDFSFMLKLGEDSKQKFEDALALYLQRIIGSARQRGIQVYSSEIDALYGETQPSPYIPS